MRNFLIYLVQKHLFLILSLVLLLAYYSSASKLPPEALVYPNLIMPLTGVIWIWNFLLVVFEYQSVVRNMSAASINLSIYNVGTTRAKVILFLLVIAYVVLLPVLGFVMTTGLFAIVASWLLGVRRFWPLLSFAVILCACLYSVFVVWLNVPFPTGPIVF